MRSKKPNDDVADRFPIIPQEMLDALQKIFPVRPVHPFSNPTEIYYEAGVQKVVTFFIETASKQKEHRNVHIS